VRIAAPPNVLGESEHRIRRALLRWDPLGVVPLGWPDDEYDDLIVPIRDALAAGVATDALAAGLREALLADYGVDPGDCAAVASDLLT
jgi:hypothetical protein